MNGIHICLSLIFWTTFHFWDFFIKQENLKKNLRYNNFIVLHFFAILINFFLMLILIKFFLLNEDFNFFKIDLEILNLIIVLYFIFLLFIYNFVKFKSLLDNLGNNFIFHKLLGKFTNFFFTIKFTKGKLLTLKFSILIMITHLFGLIFFLLFLELLILHLI
jgi:hypothetical protein